jgi:hypothetical protein
VAHVASVTLVWIKGAQCPATLLENKPKN